MNEKYERARWARRDEPGSTSIRYCPIKPPERRMIGNPRGAFFLRKDSKTKKPSFKPKIEHKRGSRLLRALASRKLSTSKLTLKLRCQQV